MFTHIVNDVQKLILLHLERPSRLANVCLVEWLVCLFGWFIDCGLGYIKAPHFGGIVCIYWHVVRFVGLLYNVIIPFILCVFFEVC